MRAHGSFTVAAALMSLRCWSSPSCTQAVCGAGDDFPEHHVRGCAGVSLQDPQPGPGEVYPYGFAQTSGELDDAVDAMSQVFQDMLKLAEIEKTSQLLAEEIEKTRRRVNALEYVKTPPDGGEYQIYHHELDENERANTIRLMKVKDMLLKEAIQERQEADAGRWSPLQTKHEKRPGSIAFPVFFVR